MISYEVESIDSIMQSNYFMAERQIRIVAGPGREASSGEVYLAVETPIEGVIVAYVTAAAPNVAERAPRQFSSETSSYCLWGSISSLFELGGE